MKNLDCPFINTVTFINLIDENYQNTKYLNNETIVQYCSY